MQLKIYHIDNKYISSKLCYTRDVLSSILADGIDITITDNFTILNDNNIKINLNYYDVYAKGYNYCEIIKTINNVDTSFYYTIDSITMVSSGATQLTITLDTIHTANSLTNTDGLYDLMDNIYVKRGLPQKFTFDDINYDKLDYTISTLYNLENSINRNFISCKYINDAVSRGTNIGIIPIHYFIVYKNWFHLNYAQVSSSIANKTYQSNGIIDKINNNFYVLAYPVYYNKDMSGYVDDLNVVSVFNGIMDVTSDNENIIAHGTTLINFNATDMSKAIDVYPNPSQQPTLKVACCGIQFTTYIPITFNVNTDTLGILKNKYYLVINDTEIPIPYFRTSNGAMNIYSSFSGGKCNQTLRFSNIKNLSSYYSLDLSDTLNINYPVMHDGVSRQALVNSANLQYQYEASRLNYKYNNIKTIYGSFTDAVGIGFSSSPSNIYGGLVKTGNNVIKMFEQEDKYDMERKGLELQAYNQRFALSNVSSGDNVDYLSHYKITNVYIRAKVFTDSDIKDMLSAHGLMINEAIDSDKLYNSYIEAISNNTLYPINIDLLNNILDRLHNGIICFNDLDKANSYFSDGTLDFIDN